MNAISAIEQNLFAQVYVAKKVEGNRFKIAGGTPGLEISWQVTGVRHDAYANVHRIPVEEVKSESDRGLYVTPEAFGQPIEKRIGYAREQLILANRTQPKQ